MSGRRTTREPAGDVGGGPWVHVQRVQLASNGGSAPTNAEGLLTR